MVADKRGQHWSLQISCFLTEGLFGHSRQPAFVFPKGTSFPQPVEIHYFRSGPISSADPICLQPITIVITIIITIIIYSFLTEGQVFPNLSKFITFAAAGGGSGGWLLLPNIMIIVMIVIIVIIMMIMILVVTRTIHHANSLILLILILRRSQRRKRREADRAQETA